jgi:hypothetical protein
MVLAIPRSRMWLARVSGLFPRASLPLTRVIRAVGERKRRKFTAASS